MTVFLSQKRTIDFGILLRSLNPELLKRLSQRWKAPRLRRKGPQWGQVALFVVFVFVADALLAAAAWIAVDFFLR
jgi:hypothetical protein